MPIPKFADRRALRADRRGGVDRPRRTARALGISGIAAVVTAAMVVTLGIAPASAIAPAPSA
ncbi:hypothetical protein, partial [Microbacterium sp. 2FI]|uniref:hypothetical protein n=1 Tax=Microbacterium sp. 2FI TaxID=2502193 RepID=UPI0010FA231A